MSIKDNTISLQNLLSIANALPEAGGVELPELSNQATASELLLNKELIDQEGNIVTGAMPNNGTISSTIDGINTKSVTIPLGYTSGGTVSLTDDIDNEVDEQADLIAQIKSTVDSLPEADSGGSSANIGICTVTITEQSRGHAYVMYTGINEGKTTCNMVHISNGTEIINAVCGTSLAIYYDCIAPIYNFSDNILPPQDYKTDEFTNSLDDFFSAVEFAYVLTPFEDGSICTITMDDDG